MGSGEDVVGEYEGRPLFIFGTHHRRPKAGPEIQSSRRERNPKGSRWLLCARAELCAAAGIWSEDWALCEAIVASSLRCNDARFWREKLASGRGKRHFMREPCSDAGFGSGKLASRAINFHIHTQEIVGRLSVYTYYIMERIYYICVFI